MYDTRQRLTLEDSLILCGRETRLCLPLSIVPFQAGVICRTYTRCSECEGHAHTHKNTCAVHTNIGYELREPVEEANEKSAKRKHAHTHAQRLAVRANETKSTKRKSYHYVYAITVGLWL